MHFYIFSSDKGPRQQELTSSNCSDDVVEPPEENDTDDDLVLSFEIISEEEVARLQFPFLQPSAPSSMSSSSPSSISISSQGSNSSLGSTGTGDYYNPFPAKPSVINPKRFFRKSPPKLSLPPLEEKLTTAPKKGPPPELTEEEMMSSTARIWYVIQLKGHYNHGLEESEEEDSYFYHHPPLTMGDHSLATMEDSSSTKMTGWFSSLLHLPQKIKQHQADKHRFNVNTSSPEVREQLKHLYVY